MQNFRISKVIERRRNVLPRAKRNPGREQPKIRNFQIRHLEVLDPLFPTPLLAFFNVVAKLQGGSGTEPEPETGTVGTVFPETESGTGTAGTVFKEPKPEPEPSFPGKLY